LGNLKGRDYTEDVGVEEYIKMIRMSLERIRFGLVSSGSG
jgi:hypothetical protein